MADPWLCDYCGYTVGGKNGVPGNTARIHRFAVTHQTFEQCHSLMNTYGDKKQQAEKSEAEPQTTVYGIDVTEWDRRWKEMDDQLAVMQRVLLKLTAYTEEKNRG